MSVQKFLSKINPKQLFLMDGLGALLSAFMLGFVLVKFESIFGMPALVLYWLAGLAGIFAIYSFSCFIGFGKNWRIYLKAIALVNLTYCGLTLSLVIYLYQLLTIWGFIYFMLEIIIVVTLSVIELKKAS